MRISDWSSDVCSSDLLRVAERLLTIEQQRRIVRRGCIRAFDDGGKLLQLVLGLLQPFLIGRGLGEIALDLLVLDDAALLKVDEQHLPEIGRASSRERVCQYV